MTVSISDKTDSKTKRNKKNYCKKCRNIDRQFTLSRFKNLKVVWTSWHTFKIYTVIVARTARRIKFTTIVGNFDIHISIVKRAIIKDQ